MQILLDLARRQNLTQISAAGAAQHGAAAEFYVIPHGAAAELNADLTRCGSARYGQRRNLYDRRTRLNFVPPETA